MEPSSRRTLRLLVGLLAGGALGLAFGAAVYLWVNPAIEARGGRLEDLQGLLWNVVPLAAAFGALLGYGLANRRR